MPKRKYVADEEETSRYFDSECPECGAIVNTRFQPGRNWRILLCPVCKNRVRVSIKEEDKNLIQLGRAGAG